MHTGARARKQKYISIYISLYMKTFLKTGVYIYIPLFQFSDHEACQVTICEAQDNFYFYSLSKSYTFPGNIVRVTMPVNLTRSVPDVCFANLGNYGLYESCLPISSYLSYYNIVTSREKVKRKKN